MSARWSVLANFAFLSGQASANEWMQNVEVVQLGNYQANASHFIWLSSIPAECKAAAPGNPVLQF